jgi:hypothetical protein
MDVGDIVSIILQLLPDSRAFGAVCRQIRCIYMTTPDYTFWRRPHPSRALPKMYDLLPYSAADYISGRNLEMLTGRVVDVKIMLERILRSRDLKQFRRSRRKCVVTGDLELYLLDIAIELDYPEFVHELAGEIDITVIDKILSADAVNTMTELLSVRDIETAFAAGCDIGIECWCALVNVEDGEFLEDIEDEIYNVAHKLSQFAAESLDAYHVCMLYDSRIPITIFPDSFDPEVYDEFRAVAFAIQICTHPAMDKGVCMVIINALKKYKYKRTLIQRLTIRVWGTSRPRCKSV